MPLNRKIATGFLCACLSVVAGATHAASWLHQKPGYTENGTIQIDDGAGGKVNAISNSTSKSVTQIRSAQPPIVIVEQSAGDLLAQMDFSKHCYIAKGYRSGVWYYGLLGGEYDSSTGEFVGLGASSYTNWATVTASNFRALGALMSGLIGGAMNLEQVRFGMAATSPSTWVTTLNQNGSTTQNTIYFVKGTFTTIMGSWTNVSVERCGGIG